MTFKSSTSDSNSTEENPIPVVSNVSRYALTFPFLYRTTRPQQKLIKQSSRAAPIISGRVLIAKKASQKSTGGTNNPGAANLPRTFNRILPSS